MYIRRTSFLLAFLFGTTLSFAQTSLNNANAMLTNRYSPKTTTSKPTKSTRFHQRLSGTFSGLTIELISADLPLERSYPLFRQFGNVHYDKLDEGGYSYIIKTDFDDKKSLEKFYKSVILPRNKQAKMVEYKFGKRNIL